MRLLSIFAGAALLAGGVFGGVSGSAQSFLLSQNGKSVGSASLKAQSSGGGSALSSSTKIDMPGLKYSFNENVVLDSGYHLLDAKLNGLVNGTAATVEARPQGQQFSMKITANGNTTNTPLTFHAQSVFFPDFDPAGLQTVLNLGAARNNRDIWALVPKQTGSISALRIATDPDEQGTLDGKPVTVHHLTVSGDASKTEVFSSPRNELLQAEWTDEGFAMVRQGFKLTPPVKPRNAPPVKPPDQPADQQGQQPSGQPPAQPNQ